jgi:hypothetical protein
MRAASILFLTILGVSGLYAPAAYSDEIVLSDFPNEDGSDMAAPSGEMEKPSGAMSTSDDGTPRRFITMEQVEKSFGTPDEKMPAVGEPPITRWVYKDYTVYFEHQQVLHTVANR